MEKYLALRLERRRCARGTVYVLDAKSGKPEAQAVRIGLADDRYTEIVEAT